MELGSQQDQWCEGRTSEHNEQQQGGQVWEHTREQNNQHDRIQDREVDDQQFTGGNEEKHRGQDKDLQDGENILYYYSHQIFALFNVSYRYHYRNILRKLPALLMR